MECPRRFQAVLPVFRLGGLSAWLDILLPRSKGPLLPPAGTRLPSGDPLSHRLLPERRRPVVGSLELFPFGWTLFGCMILGWIIEAQPWMLEARVNASISCGSTVILARSITCCRTVA